MPKVKKGKKKIVSLVAYESGAESGTENEEENTTVTSSEESGQSEDDDKSGSESSNTSKSESNTINNDDNLSNSSNRMPHLAEKSESQSAAFAGDSVSAENDLQTNLAECSSSSANESKYTLQNGFPPGCSSIKLPAAPSAPCSQALQNKINIVLDRMANYNYSINDDIYRKKSFKNPSIYDKLILDIDEHGSSFPTHIEDLKANGFMFYDELDQAQRTEWAKKDKERKEKQTKVEITTGVKKKI